MSYLKIQNVLIVCCTLLGGIGCARLDLEDRLNWKKAEVESVATRMVPMWTNTVLYEQDQPGIRGFGARIYFYENKEPEPIPVKGSLVVYAFDSSRYDAHDTKPEKKFVFTAEQFEKHQSSSKLGESYSIWLPWGKVGGEPRQLTLITKFRSADGRVIISDPARKLLPGVPLAPQSEEEMLTGGLGVKKASYEPSEPKDQSAVTIDLPPSFYRRFGATDSDEKTPRQVFGQITVEPPAAGEAVMPYRQRLADHFGRTRRPVQSQRSAQRSAGSWWKARSPTTSRSGLRALPEVTDQNSPSFDD